MGSEYIIYCDESESKGQYCSNFYGGVLARSKDLSHVTDRLQRRKTELNLFGEVKWQKVSQAYLQKYNDLMDTFFDLVRRDEIKVRIMFTQNRFRAQNLGAYHLEYEYFLLYYQFVKHAFGLGHSNAGDASVNVRVYFDKLPDTREKCELFKDFIHGINRWPEFVKARIEIRRDQLAEVDSRDHVLLQCLDVVLGAVQFRLNQKHVVKPVGARRRAKKTIAKEKLYKHINKHIRQMYPGFNVGITTGMQGDKTNIWRHPYRHWLFVPRDARLDSDVVKKK
jgi:hypothetical protein